MNPQVANPSLGKVVTATRALAFGLGLVASLEGCTNASERFSGQWVMAQAVRLNATTDARLELGVGHYGPELVGVLRVEDAFGSPLAGCTCAVVEGGLVRPDADAFTAFADDPCGGGDGDSGRWAFDLTLDANAEPRVLSGTITRADGGPLEVVFEEIDSFVDPGFKACP